MSGQVADSSIKLNFSLPSGRCETVSVLQSSTIADLKTAAQQSFGQRFLRLAAPDGRIFDPKDSLRLSGFQDGDSLAVVAQQPKVAATAGAFTLWCVGVDTLAATVHKSKSSSAMFSRFVAHDLLLLRFCQMELW